MLMKNGRTVQESKHAFTGKPTFRNRRHALSTGYRLIHALRRFALALTAAPLFLVNSAATAEESGFVLHRGNPVLPVGPSGAWDSAFIDPAAVIYHDGMYHSFYAAVPTWPYDLAIGHASSPDAVNWTRSGSDPVLVGAAADFESRSINSNSAIITDDGQWVLYFTIATHGAFKGSIGRAVASGPTGPWVVDPEPVLQPGPKGAWDHNGIGNASVLRTDAGYVMYFSGEGVVKGEKFSETHTMVGLARSDDGVAWIKHDDPVTVDGRYRESDPVLRDGEAEDGWMKSYITDPNVQRTADGWAMVFRGGNGKKIGYATSRDGIVWEHAFESPILVPSAAGVSEIYFTSFLHRDGVDYVFFEGGSFTEANGFLATRGKPDK